MRVLRYIYDSRTADPAVERVLDRLAARDESVEHTDVGAAEDPADARREAMLAVGAATRVGRKPSELYDEDGRPDLSAGALITEEETGRRDLHVGEAAVEALRDDGAGVEGAGPDRGDGAGGTDGTDGD